MTSPSVCSPFWRAIMKDHGVTNLGLIKEISNGKTIAF